jgi:hypothetical protein
MIVGYVWSLDWFAYRGCAGGPQKVSYKAAQLDSIASCSNSGLGEVCGCTVQMCRISDRCNL